MTSTELPSSSSSPDVLDAPIAGSRLTLHLPPGYRSRKRPGDGDVVAAFTRGEGITYGLGVGEVDPDDPRRRHLRTAQRRVEHARARAIHRVAGLATQLVRGIAPRQVQADHGGVHGVAPSGWRSAAPAASAAVTIRS